MEYPWTPNDLDERIWREELDEFVPQRVFDVHTHSYLWAHNLDPNKNTSGYGAINGTPFEESSFAILDTVDAALFPGRTVDRLAFPFPYPQCDFDGANRYIAGQVANAPKSAVLMLVHPSMTTEYI